MKKKLKNGRSVKMIKYILAWRFVKSILDNARVFEWSDGKAKFAVDEGLLKALFPKEYAEAKERAEKDV